MGGPTGTDFCGRIKLAPILSECFEELVIQGSVVFIVKDRESFQQHCSEQVEEHKDGEEEEREEVDDRDVWGPAVGPVRGAVGRVNPSVPHQLVPILSREHANTEIERVVVKSEVHVSVEV